MDFFSTELTFQPTRWLLVVNNRHIKFGSITSPGKGTVLIWLPHKKCIAKFWLAVNITSNIWTTRFWNIFSGSSSTTNEPNFKIVCNCIIHEFNVFEDSAQREHTIAMHQLQIWASCEQQFICVHNKKWFTINEHLTMI